VKVGITQSCYIPWRGYFDFIDSVDLFIVYDDVQYPLGKSWRNRNLVKTAKGLKWLTVPVGDRLGLAIDQVLIGHGRLDKPWQETHRGLLKASLRPAPFFQDAMQIWNEGITHNDTTISQLNIRLIRVICNYLNIQTQIFLARDFNVPPGDKAERPLEFLKCANATAYLSGPTARDYLKESLFRENGIRLEYKTYDYSPYPQLWGDFISNVTVLDLIANTGPAARDFLKSATPNQVAVE